MGVLSMVLLFLLSGCAPHWMMTQERIEYGDGYELHVASYPHVAQACRNPLLYGCTWQEGEEIIAYSVPNRGVINHEMGHIQRLQNGDSEGKEWLRDIAYGWLLGNIMMLLTIWSS